MSKLKIGVLGGGNMGGAIIGGIHRNFSVLVCEQDKKKALRLKKKYRVANVGLPALVQRSSVIILAVKPQDFDSILEQVKGYLTKDKLVISIAAGITTAYIEKRLGKVRVIRTMPNLPALVGEAMTGICRGKSADPKDLSLACRIFGFIGKTAVVDEKKIDIITAISGSGPAYVFLFVECLLKAARSLGLNEQESQTLVGQTLRGSLKLLQSQKEDASVLRARVTSKGGTTQAAMDVFFANKIGQIFNKALLAARNRAKELSK